MTTPVLNLVRPTKGWSAGGTLVQLDGGGFRMPTKQQPRMGITPEAPPSVRVLFDGKPATKVQVISSAIIRCITPYHPPTRERNGVQITNGVASVVVQNLDDDGNVIGTATLSDAYEFVRPELGTKNVRGAWVRVADAFVEHWKNIFSENVRFNPSVDYDADMGELSEFVEFADLPGIAITRVSFPDSAMEPEGGPVLQEVTAEVLLEKRPPMASDWLFTLILVSDNMGELLNLCEVVKTCFRDASKFRVQVDEDDPSLGEAEFSMVQTGPLSLSERIGTTDVVTAEVTAAIYRVLSLDLPGAPEEALPGMPQRPHQGTRAIAPRVQRISVGRTRK
jgi:hypothetical protein